MPLESQPRVLALPLSEAQRLIQQSTAGVASRSAREENRPSEQPQAYRPSQTTSIQTEGSQAGLLPEGQQLGIAGFPAPATFSVAPVGSIRGSDILTHLGLISEATYGRVHGGPGTDGTEVVVASAILTNAFVPETFMAPFPLLGPWDDSWVWTAWFDLLSKFLNSDDPTARRMAYVIVVLYWPLEMIETVARVEGDRLDPEALDLWTMAYNQVRDRVEAIDRVLNCADDSQLMSSVRMNKQRPIRAWLSFNTRLRDWLRKHRPATKAQLAKLKALRTKIAKLLRPLETAETRLRQAGTRMSVASNAYVWAKRLGKPQKDIDAALDKLAKASEDYKQAAVDVKTVKEVQAWWK